MKAYLMNRDVNPAYGASEWRKTEDGNILEVDFNVHVRQTMVYPYDIEKDRIEDWAPLLVRHKDMTGGRAIRDLGHEPAEEAEHGKGQDKARKDS